MKLLKLFDSPIWILFELFFGPYLTIHGNELPPSVFDWWIIGALMMLHVVLTFLGWFLKLPIFHPKTT
ncbi:unnamed protein product, partial [marine sediment metagenome]